MSTNIEVCHIRFEETRKDEQYPRGSLILDILTGGGGPSPKRHHYGRYIAEVVHSSRKEIIAQTSEFMSYSSEVSASENIQLDSDVRHLFVQQLLNDGWEMMTTNDRGEVESLKRQISAVSSDDTSSPATLLKQLASLLDAGILTEEEFQAKKAEILRRM